MGGADQLPFAGAGGETPSSEATHAPNILGLTEHRFDDRTAPPVEGLGPGLGESVSHPEKTPADRPGRARPSFGCTPRGDQKSGSGHRLDRRHIGLAPIALVGEDRPDPTAATDLA